MKEGKTKRKKKELTEIDSVREGGRKGGFLKKTGIQE